MARNAAAQAFVMVGHLFINLRVQTRQIIRKKYIQHYLRYLLAEVLLHYLDQIDLSIII